MSTVTKPILTDETFAAKMDALVTAVGKQYYTITVTMKGTNDNPVHDESVIVKDGASGYVLYTIPYTGVPVQVDLARDQSYLITGTQVNLASTGFYSPDSITGVAQADTAVTVTYQVLDEANSLLAIQTVIQANPGVEILPVGTEVTVPWVADNGTEYDNVFVLTHYGYFVKAADATTGALTWMAVFMQKYAGLHDIQFDGAEAEEATESTAAAGLYYYGLTGTTYTLLELSQGDAIPYGSYDHVYHNEIRDTTYNILKYGYGRWSHSAYRQWLNSDAAAGSWWSAKHIGDCAPNQAGSYRGYMAGFRADDLRAIQTIKVTTALNTVTDSGIGTLEDTYDKFWLPSIKEMYGVEQLAGEGDVWHKYWRDYIGLSGQDNAANNLRKFYAVNNHSSAQIVRLRSAYRGNSSYVWIVYSSGQVSNYYYASDAYRSAPACAIG